MQELFESVNNLFGFIAPVSNAVWDFPTQFATYRSIPLLGQLSLAVIILLGMGIVFTVKTGFVQTLSFTRAIPIMLRKRSDRTGISALASFLLGLAMRAGPGNIVGVTGAITVGGPGALFWMWVAALFGMATAFMESVLAQLFKEKKDNEYVGGMPFYGRRIVGNKRIVGIVLSVAFMIYALFNVPVQTFNVFTAIGMIADTATGTVSDRQSTLYYGIAMVMVASCAWLILGGIRRVTAYTNVLVPIKATVFCLISLLIVLINLPLIPSFFSAVLVGAFSPDALFGGAMGVALAEGVKRGLMSNEAGQGTITMAAAAADNDHPCEQGFVQSLGVFFDTLIICTLTGFIVVLAHLWTGSASSAEWASDSASRIGTYLTSVEALVPAFIAQAVIIILAACYALFAFTTLLGMISFAEISANFISRSTTFILGVRVLGSLVFVPFGALTVLAGLELGNLWTITDLTNIIMVYLNIPILLLGAPLVYKALAHYRATNGGKFISADIGIETEHWTHENQKHLR
ncbi:alanine/glycine:cation symporter family protein [Pseudohongiella sp.]|uniref:Amino acid carrier protein n=1 Tax=marine sediment metagenome TaxID=412755 RepID=A0A0F9W3K7_9ZZZZ|nr:amino acid carrier protein [Pseudohongiella sp.]HDZ09999.1 amino acid carrier protein [Pseudohongiella sp.]HEA63895.1 amino acid carrier protein [Pseudohongiella sp.]